MLLNKVQKLKFNIKFNFFLFKNLKGQFKDRKINRRVSSKQ